jgi:hypothetical protein
MHDPESKQLRLQSREHQDFERLVPAEALINARGTPGNKQLIELVVDKTLNLLKELQKEFFLSSSRYILLLHRSTQSTCAQGNEGTDLTVAPTGVKQW